MRKEFQKAYHALLKGVVTVKVKFEAGGRLYTYRALESDELQPGDTVVIQYNGKFFTTEVVEVDQYPDFSKDVEYKWIVCKVDEERYAHFLEQEHMFEQQMLALSANKEAEATKKELIELYGEENVGYLAGIAQGKVMVPTFNDVIDTLLQNFADGADLNGSVVEFKTGPYNGEAVQRQKDVYVQVLGRGLRKMEGPRVDWESRYNKHIANMHTLNGFTWRDFMAPGANKENKEDVTAAKILFDRFKRKQYPIEQYIEEFKDKL
ncbi:hypothetical protein [Escherichia coli]|uniref:hypothetical protein n=1 Tax=Escherichia coli TaxID=562 RepID=UPI001F42BC52|nr:hypothetical protein [Escherichia coli]